MKIFHPTYNLFFGPPCMYESYIILGSLLRDHTENNYPPTSNTNQRVKESLVWNLYIVRNCHPWYPWHPWQSTKSITNQPFFVTNILARETGFVVAPRIQNAKNRLVYPLLQRGGGPNHYHITIGSMHGIFGYIYHRYQPNVGKYTIHGSYGIYKHFVL